MQNVVFKRERTFAVNVPCVYFSCGMAQNQVSINN